MLAITPVIQQYYGMDIDVINFRLFEIPLIPLGKIADDHEIWEGDEGGVHFKVTRQPLPSPFDREMYFLSISGNPVDAERLIEDFSQVLGRPRIAEPLSRLSTEMIMIVWEVKKSDWGGEDDRTNA